MAPYRKRGCPERLSTANSVSVKDQVRDRCRRSVVVGRWLKRRGSEVSARPRAYRVEGQRTECVDHLVSVYVFNGEEANVRQQGQGVGVSVG